MALHESEQKRKSSSTVRESISHRKGKVLEDNRPKTAVQQTFHNSVSNISEKKVEPIQKKKNNTGLPDPLKTGIENLSGHSMDDVKVHYNSEKPSQLNAHAYAQGTNIHLAAGQEKHLPHEAWHVVQQKQGRVKPTLQMKGNIKINDDAGLEKEADVMGQKALENLVDHDTPKELKLEIGAPVAQLFITRDPHGLKVIMDRLREAYKGKVDESVILQKALAIWQVNEHGRTLKEEIAFTLDHFGSEENEKDLEIITGLAQEIGGSSFEGFEPIYGKLSDSVNAVQDQAHVYPLKQGAEFNVYGLPKVFGTPSSQLSQRKAKELQHALERYEVFKRRWNAEEERKIPTGYMMGIAHSCRFGWIAAFSGENEPCSEDEKITFTNVAKKLGFDVIKQIGNLEQLLDTMRSRAADVGGISFEDPGKKVDKKGYSTVHNAQTKEKGRAEIGTCAGAKMEMYDLMAMTELYIHPENGEVSILDAEHEERRYNPMDDHVPSCINCQFLIPIEQEKFIDFRTLREKDELASALERAEYQIRLLEGLESRKEEFIESALSRVRSNKKDYGDIRRKLGDRELIVTIGKQIDQMILAMIKNFGLKPDEILTKNVIPSKGIPTNIADALKAQYADVIESERIERSQLKSAASKQHKPKAEKKIAKTRSTKKTKTPKPSSAVMAPGGASYAAIGTLVLAVAVGLLLTFLIRNRYFSNSG